MEPAPTRRGIGLDAARGVAVLLIFVAQTAPADGPFHVLLFSEFVPPPLLALLIGMTAQTAAASGGRWPLFVTWGGGLVLIGVLLSQVPSQVIGVLVYLGVLAALCALLTRLPSLAVLGVLVVLFAVEPWLKRVSFDWYVDHLMQLRDSWSGRRVLELVDLVAAGPAYRLTSLAIFACGGILLVRLVHGRRAHGIVAGAALVLAVGGYVADKLGGPQLDPYTGTHQVLLFNLFSAILVCEATRFAATQLPRAAAPLADVGGMWLTMYVLMVLGTAGYLQLRPAGTRDDSWVVLGALIVGSLVLAVAWARVLRGTRFEEGPLEGLFDLLARRDPRGVPTAA